MSIQRSSDDPSLPVEVQRQINQVCDHFEQVWKAGETPSISRVLDTLDEAHRSELLRELVLLDLGHRWRDPNNGDTNDTSDAPKPYEREGMGNLPELPAEDRRHRRHHRRR